MAMYGPEVAPNLFCMGICGFMKTFYKFTIAQLGGSYNEEKYYQPPEKFEQSLNEKCFHRSDVQKLSKRCDILFSSEWPEDVQENSTLPERKLPKGCMPLAALAANCMPQYFFVPGPVYYEREPYKNSAAINVNTGTVTHFVALAPFKNSKNEKFSYAFTLYPLTTEYMQPAPPNCTASPFEHRPIPLKRASEDQIIPQQTNKFHKSKSSTALFKSKKDSSSSLNKMHKSESHSALNNLHKSESGTSLNNRRSKVGREFRFLSLRFFHRH